MARSLARNTQLFATSLDISGLVGGDLLSSCNPENTFELKVLDGYSFSQDVATQEVGVNESDSTCTGSGLARGTLSFNTALNPVDVSFSTYVRPYQNTEEVDGNDTGSTGDWTDCVERILWASAMGTKASWNKVINPAQGVAADEVIESQDGTSIKFGLGASNANELLDLTLFFVLEQTTYKILDFNVSTAEVDFSIDGIATINWTGQGSRVIEDEASHTTIKGWGTGGAGTNYRGVPTTTPDTFLRNKLSVLELTDNKVADWNYATVTANGTDTVDSVNGSTGVITVDTGTLGADTYRGGIVRNSTLNEWAFVETNDNGGVNTGTITVSDEYASLIGGWGVGNTLELYRTNELGIDPADTFDAFDSTTGVMDLVNGNAQATGYYDEGRVVNLETGEWAQIVSSASGTPDTITIASADRAKVALWPADSTTYITLFTKDQNAGTRYCIPITGASLSLENNMTYLTPEELAIVNLPLAGFAGNRVTSGNFTAYLNTGAEGSGGLLQDMLSKIQTSVSNNYHIKFLMGGSTGRRVEFDIAHANVSVPTTNVEDLITTEISFSAKPWDDTNNEASFEDTNELVIEYFD